MLAITQPIRIGDLVTFEETTGEVEDVRLTYTYLRLDDGSRLVVPNERLAQGSIENHTVVDPRAQVEVSVWLAPGADADRALELITAEDDVRAVVAEVDTRRHPAVGDHLGGHPARARPGRRRAPPAVAPPAPGARSILSGSLLSAPSGGHVL